jgi:hypothetical protein
MIIRQETRVSKIKEVRDRKKNHAGNNGCDDSL